MTAIVDQNRRVARRAGLMVLVMLGLAFAAVPFYRAFCQLTGYQGTTQRAAAAPGARAAEGLTSVRFDANISPQLPWRFEPEQGTVKVVPGARNTVYFKAANLSARTTTGQAVFNVTPEQAGIYFSKIQCFCFTEQTLKPGEVAHMPVVFFVDPKLRTDPATKDIAEITLSYTFYPTGN